MSMMEERIKRSAKVRPSTANVRTSQQQLQRPSTATESSMKVKPEAPTNNEKQKSNVVDEKGDQNRDEPKLPEMKPGLPPDIQKILDQIEVIDEEFKEFSEIPVPTYTTPEWLTQDELTPNAREQVDLVLSRLIHTDNNVCLTAIHQISEIMAKFEFIDERVDQLIINITTKLKSLTEISLSEVSSPKASIELKQLFTNVCKSFLQVCKQLFTNMELMRSTTSHTLYNFMRVVCNMAVDVRLVKCLCDNDGHLLIETINKTIHELLDKCSSLVLGCATVKLVKFAVSQAPMLESDRDDKIKLKQKVDFYTLTMKCHIRVMRKVMKDAQVANNETENLSKFLLEIDEYWNEFPPNHRYPAVWSEVILEVAGKVTDRADKKFMLKTIKTVATTLYDKMQQDKVILSLDLVADNAKSQMMSLAAKQFKVSTSQLKSMVQQAKLQKRENTMKENSISVEGKLAEIFKKLSKGDTMDEAIEDIYVFKQTHPQFDIDSKIDGLSLNCMKNYIRQKLKQIDIDKDENLDSISKRVKKAEMAVEHYSGKTFMDDINQMRAVCGLEPLQEKINQAENINPDQENIIKKPTSRISKLERPQTGSRLKQGPSLGGARTSQLQKPTNNLNDLRKRFQSIKERQNKK